jgi:hypothetical protein
MIKAGSFIAVTFSNGFFYKNNLPVIIGQEL